MRRVALIPARGGSKRLPRKNIIEFMGKPMIAWTIEAARQSGMFDRVIVSTEDVEIQSVAESYGAEIDERAAGLATDEVRVLDVCLDFLDREQSAGQNWDVLSVLYATAPLRTEQDIKEVVELVDGDQCHFSLAVTHYDLPPHQALVLGEENKVKPMWPEFINKRSSDVGDLVVDNGSTYAVFVPSFLKEKTFYGQNLSAHVMPRERSHDIDEEVDLEITRFFAGQGEAAA